MSMLPPDYQLSCKCNLNSATNFHFEKKFY